MGPRLELAKSLEIEKVDQLTPRFSETTTPILLGLVGLESLCDPKKILGREAEGLKVRNSLL